MGYELGSRFAVVDLARLLDCRKSVVIIGWNKVGAGVCW